MNLPAASWVERLGLQPHPEGGYFRRIFTDARTVGTAGGDRAAASSIHYLLDAASPQGRLHRNRSRILHYLQHGGPVRYWLLAADGVLTSTTLGVGAGEALFLDVPGGVWKASELVDGADHALATGRPCRAPPPRIAATRVAAGNQATARWRQRERWQL